jgi:signal transduction histidine kinase
MPDASPYPGGPPLIAWRPFRGPFQRWPHTSDFLLACVSLVITLGFWFGGSGTDGLQGPGDAAVLLCVFLGNFALLWRRTHPVHVHAAVLTGSVLALLGSMTEGLFALVFSLYSLGRYADDDRASLIGMLAALAFVAFKLVVPGPPGVDGVIAASLVMLLWYVGRRLRFRGEYLRLLEERARILDRERHVEAERAVAEERARIARELHDVVAHQVSLMTVQAGAAKIVAASDPRAATEAMAAVENAGRQALTEMRHLLSVLRPAGGAEDLVPQPGIADLPRLVREVTSAGPDVSLHRSGSLSHVPARLELTVYRIVQEALTNVLKHAGAGAHAAVEVHGDDERVEVLIRDDGGTGGTRRDEPQRGHGRRDGGAAADARRVALRAHGIAGMRERAELLGGTLSAGPLANGGFEVRAVLPTAASAG